MVAIRMMKPTIAHEKAILEFCADRNYRFESEAPYMRVFMIRDNKVVNACSPPGMAMSLCQLSSWILTDSIVYIRSHTGEWVAKIISPPNTNFPLT